MSSVNVFISSSSANSTVSVMRALCSVAAVAIRRKQTQILQVLQVKKIEFLKRDIAVSDEDKKEFRRLMTLVGDPNALPPQIFNSEGYCGDYESFYEAVEDNELNRFLQLTTNDANNSTEDIPSQQNLENMASDNNTVSSS